MKKISALGLAVLFCLCMPFVAAAEKVGGGDLTFKPKGAAPVVFSHEYHVNAKGLKCTGCHYQVFQMTQGSYKMDMSKLTKGDFCGKCHNGQKSFDVKDTKNCTKCHK
ncbi:MAG TPA: c(7)-type cytochrome triheme domain-containing protein [Nitrospirota bacterium]|nr:c(7)-type cytochrome triheme domain-containing protein [Nitrospirota bacterium]